MVLAVVLGVLVALLVAPDEAKKEQPQLPPKPEKVTLTIKAVGDNLIHSPVYNSCRGEDGFNFDGLYENIIPYIKDADIAAINQETIFIEDRNKISAYPIFGSPPEIGDSLVRTGFDVVLHASNHTIDTLWQDLTATPLGQLLQCQFFHSSLNSPSDGLQPLPAHPDGIFHVRSPDRSHVPCLPAR